MDKAEAAIKFIDWLTLAAIFIGPIVSAVVAIAITRIAETRKETQGRRLELFKVLMRTRGSRLNPEHVGALNLIEIEYYKESRVLHALEKYFQHLNDTQTTGMAWLNRGDHLFTKLLYEVARSLGYEIEQLQILTGGYVPRGWEESEQRQAEIQNGLLSVLRGQTALLIKPQTDIPPATFVVPPGFPPPPTN